MSQDLSIQPGLFFVQWLGVLTGLGLMTLGGAILWSVLEWRLRGQTVTGVIVGVRRRGPYFHTVYRYAASDGEAYEATSVLGGASLEGRTSGRQVPILVKSARPDEAHESHSPAASAMGLLTLFGGGWLSYDTATSWPHSLITWLIVGGVSFFLLRAIARRFLRFLVTIRPQGAMTDWEAMPVESADTRGPSPAPGIRVTSTVRLRGGKPFAIAGIVVLATAAVPAYRLQHLHAGLRTGGTVLSLHQNTTNSNHYGLFPEVRYVATDGSSQTFLDRAGASPSPYQVGDPVTVLYQPGKPDTAMIDHGAGNWEPVVALLVLGGTLLGVSWLARRQR